jgi:hypothetical protein
MGLVRAADMMSRMHADLEGEGHEDDDEDADQRAPAQAGGGPKEQGES